MVQCEMCGTETASPNRVKIEGAELKVCDECAEFGTEVQTDSGGSTSTKYSTGSSDDSSGTAGSTTGTSASGGSSRRRDMYDEIDELAQDYDDRLRSAREAANLSREDLADQLNEKASLIGKLERGDTLPSDEVQHELERALDIDLTAGGETDETEWESETASGGYTLGDVVERKD
ncbi:TIGR00270 family protein [Halobacteriales archaeon QH_10_67_13]|nr:MAG: TIGR00270 family protein [Halobacteriales archaeon QH_10_67_13]